jgi:transcriptional regulator with XRE-family HTH domain
MFVAKKIDDELKRKVAVYLNREMIEWQRAQGVRKTSREFAAYLGVSSKSLNDWLNAVVSPRDDNVIKIANKLGYDIYDILEWVRPEKPPPSQPDHTNNHPLHQPSQTPPPQKTKTKKNISPDNANIIVNRGGVNQ